MAISRSGQGKNKWERKGCQSDQPDSSGIYQAGPKGGCFTLDTNGGKKYVDHSYCGH